MTVSGAQVAANGLRALGWLLTLAAAVAGVLLGMWIFDHYHPDPWKASADVVALVVR